MTLQAILLFVVAAILGGWEIYALMNHHKGDTWSEMVWATATKRPLVPFLFGLVSGHFFWQAAR